MNLRQHLPLPQRLKLLPRLTVLKPLKLLQQRLLPLYIALLPLSESVGEEIYRWIDDEGKVHYGDRPPSDAATERVQVRVNTYQDTHIQAMEKVFFPEARVVMFSASWCGVCRQAKNYFHSHNIAYRELDIETNSAGREGFAALNGTGVPIILVGNRRLNGFSPAAFEQIYQPATTSALLPLKTSDDSLDPTRQAKFTTNET